MKRLRSITCHPENPEDTLSQIEESIKQKVWIHLLSSKGQRISIPEAKLPEQAGVIISSGGSTGGPHQCLIPFSHLDQSADASATWLKKQGLNPIECRVFNSLPLNHISGLISWWRSRCWHSEYISMKPSLMRSQDFSNEVTVSSQNIKNKPLITSLVPAQLSRLISTPSGIRWLQSFAIIWLGGSLLPDDLAETARNLKLRLAPCYGATETTAMVAIQSPEDFLLGISKYCDPLTDVEFRLGENNRLAIRTSRLAKIQFINGQFKKISNNDGWWESGDTARLIKGRVKLLGRIDSAINSGGETVYPETLQVQLLSKAKNANIPIEELFLLPTNDQKWGQRLIALVRISQAKDEIDESEVLINLQKLSQKFPPCERPISWHSCPDLKKNSLGKFEKSQCELLFSKLGKIKG